MTFTPEGTIFEFGPRVSNIMDLVDYLLSCPIFKHHQYMYDISLKGVLKNQNLSDDIKKRSVEEEIILHMYRINIIGHFKRIFNINHQREELNDREKWLLETHKKYGGTEEGLNKLIKDTFYKETILVL